MVLLSLNWVIVHRLCWDDPRKSPVSKLVYLVLGLGQYTHIEIVKYKKEPKFYSGLIISPPTPGDS